MQEKMRISNTFGISEIVYKPKFSTICSIGQEAFWGTVHIKYYPEDYLLEFMAFDAWLKSMALKQMTIEELCRKIHNQLSQVLQCEINVSVEAYTNAHYPAEVTIE